MNDSTMHNRTFSKRLKEARLAKGLSQKQLGILAGIDEFVASPRINRYEKGVHQANIEIVQQLADVLELPLAYFYADDDDLASMIRNWYSADAVRRKGALNLLLSSSIE
ncbi:helix-turn-helix domain-containing protein [Citrobacter freundii]|uniref:helix-turn-helix domain-containing protein n=1 Tax=Citrobacter freundii TaxID=546 RepID=UPI002B3A4B59|nr:helix-turn-helix transcriptional regulator [Citrobacter freundii]